jgi:FdhD protein
MEDQRLPERESAAAVERPSATTSARVVAVDQERVRSTRDLLVTEEPLEIRVIVGASTWVSTVTMRTPGADFELAAGFLHGEQLIRAADDIRRISYCVDRTVEPAQRYNIVNVALRDGAAPELSAPQRSFGITSSCGVCGKANLDALRLRGVPPISAGQRVAAATVRALPEALRTGQRLFASTGGLHAAGLFDTAGRLLGVREDVGRHNAVDKLLGWALLERRLPLDQHLLLVSGRTSYEILQKALVAGIPVVCAVSAPSSLAVELASEFGMTLVGFLRGERFNIYAGAERIEFGPDSIVDRC